MEDANVRLAACQLGPVPDQCILPQETYLSKIKDMPVSSALKGLDEEARAIDIEQDNNTAFQWGRQFYIILQYIQDSPFRGMGLLSREEIDAISKLQKKEDTSVTADIQGLFGSDLSHHRLLRAKLWCFEAALLANRVEYATVGMQVEVQLFGAKYAATVLKEPLYDPKNEKIKC